MLLTKLRPSQLEAVEKAKPLGGFALYGQQRTGKTLTAIALMDAWKPPHVLIVCRPKGIPVWQSEFQKHWEADWDVNIEILSFGEFIYHRDKWIKWAKKLKGDLLVIVDESHRIKRRGSKGSRGLRTLGRQAKYRLILSGTPISQGNQDAWAQFDFIQPGVFGTYQEFEEKFLNVVTVHTPDKSWKKIKGPKNLKEFNRIYHQYCYRVTLDEVRGKRTMIRRVQKIGELRPVNRLLYDTVMSDLEAECNGFFVETAEKLGAILKCQQITGGFVKDADGEWRRTGTEKLELLCKTIEEYELTKQRFIICCRFLAEIEAIEDLLRTRYGLTSVVIKGGTKFDGVFKEDVAIVQIQSGESIDLSAARVTVFYSCDYSFIDFDQFRYRMRSYDTNQVTEVFLILKDTVDEKIYRVVTRKEKLANLINDDWRRRR